MRGIDAQSIELETGRWFFEPEACEKASTEQAAFPGCVTALAGGPPDATHPAPPTFPADTVTREPPPRPTPPPPPPRERPQASPVDQAEEKSAPEKEK